MRKQSKETLSFDVYEWVYFAQLLQKGYSFEASLKLMNRSNKTILQLLENGTTVESVLRKSCKGRFKTLFIFFAQFTGISEALISASNIYNFEQGMKGKVTKQTAYPLFILFFSFISVYMFSAFIIPQLLQNFEVDQNFMFIVVRLLKFLSQIILICLVAALVTVVLCKASTFLMCKIGYLLATRIGFFKGLLSYYLSNYLIVLHNCGLSTQQSFMFMKDLKGQPLLQKVVYKIYHDLLKGKDLSEIIRRNKVLADDFKMHYAIGAATNTFTESLSAYRELQENRWLRQVKKIGISIQIVSYTFIGILVVCVYQIMLLPLQMLERM